MANVVVTGITGFIGSNLSVELVNQGWDVIGTYRDRRKLHRISEIKEKITLFEDKDGGFPTIRKLFKQGKEIDTIYHLAAQTSHIFSVKNPLIDLSSNIIPTINILELIKQQPSNKRAYFVFPSSKGVIGIPKTTPVNENSSCSPEDPYSLNKLYCEKFLNLYFRKFGIDSTVFRITNSFGPKQSIISPEKGFINYFIGLRLQKKKISIFGSGMQKRDISFVSDIINAFIISGEKKIEGYNLIFLGTGKGVTIKDLAVEIGENTKISIENIPYPPEYERIEVGDFIVDNSKAKALLNWKPQVSWRDGIKRTIRYYMEHDNLKKYLNE